MTSARAVVPIAILGLASGCASPSCPPIVVAPRDFTVAPAIVDLPGFTRLLAVSDVHGGYDRLVALLVRHGVLAEVPATPEAARWTAGATTLVLVGDLIDKGAQSLEVIDLVRALEVSAAAAGGQVVTTLGNHEAEFLADPYNGKADSFDHELAADHLDPCLVATTESRGRWLRARPFAARVGDWFLAHAGQGRYLPHFAASW